MARSLRGKVVVVTGGSSGIGRAAALAFAREGCHLVVAARRPEPLREAREAIEALGARALAVPTDVADRVQVQRLLDAALEHFGRVDVWANNAGYGMAASVEQTTPDDMRRIWETNYMGAFHGCQVALRQMRRQGSGHLVNVSSMAGRFALPLGSAYAATKAAMNALGESLRAELEGTGLHATTVMPGFTRTPFFQAMERKVPDVEGLWFPAAAPEDVARRIVRAVRRPVPVVMLVPAPRLTLAVIDLLPGIWSFIARRYLRARTAGRGLPEPPQG